MRIKFLAVALSALVMGGCAGSGPDLDPTINPNEVVEEARPVIEESKRIGVTLDEARADLIRNERRDYISTDEPADLENIDPSRLSSDKKMEVSLNYDGVDIKLAMDIFSKLVGENIVVGNDVTGSVSIRLKDVPWQDALQAILNTRALSYETEPGLIRIHQRESLLAEEDFFKQRLEKFRDNQRLLNGILPVRTEIFRVFYADLDDLRSQILEVVSERDAGQTAPRTVISIDRRQKGLIVKATAKKMDTIEKLVESLDKPVEQVLIEAFVVEAGDGFNKALGTELGLTTEGQVDGDPSLVSGVQSGVAGNMGDQSGFTLGGAGTVSAQSIEGATSGLGILIGSTDQLKLALTALETKNISKTVSNPKVFTLDTVTASIAQGREQPYQSASGDGSGGTTTEFKEAQLRLDVTPTVVGDGNVILEIQLQKDTVAAAQIGSDPAINTMDLETRLLVPDGAIVVIGGIYEDAESQTSSSVPGLGDVPGIGRLFRSDSEDNSQNELLIFISPNVI